jgi:hypothetical protein
MTVGMFQVVALIFQGVECLVLHLPPATTDTHQFFNIVLNDLYVGYPSVEISANTLPVELLEFEVIDLGIQVLTIEYQTIMPTGDAGLTSLRCPLPYVEGIVRFPQFQFDMVRLGIELYGVDSAAEIQKDLQVVQTLKASISQIKTIDPPETVGYSRRGVLNRPSRIATISIGYADGLLRGSGNGRFAVWLHGKRATIVGNVCMDMTMVDVTDIPEAQEGNEVEVFGGHIPVQELATVLNTIPYEVFNSMSDRVKRVYFQE